MKKIAIVILWIAAAMSYSFGQSAPSNPAMTYGMVPTVGQWNNWFQQKQDTLGYTPVNRAGDIMQGKLTTKPSTSSSASLNIAPGQAPASPLDGDLWMDNTGLYTRVGGITVGPIRSGNIQGPVVSVVGDIPTFATTDGSVLQDSGKQLPAGAVVGTTDTQSLANKTITSAEISGSVITPIFGGSLTSAGTDQGGAYAIKDVLNIFTAVSTGTGARLPTTDPNSGSLSPGYTVEIMNSGSNPVLIYPPSSQRINGNAINAAVQIYMNGFARFTYAGSSTWFVR